MPQSQPQDRRQFLQQSTAGLLSAAAAIPGQARADDKQGLRGFAAKTRSVDSPLKQLARSDYHENFARYGGRLSNPVHQLFQQIESARFPTFDFLIIGSGYGASILATRLSAQAHENVSVAIFERGREWVTGSFPDRFRDCSQQVREGLIGPTARKLTNPLGLYDIRVNDEVDVLSGSGLGGTSLINCSIALRPEPELFAQSQWPQRLNLFEELQPYYDLAELSLGIANDPFPMTGKARAQRCAAERLAVRNDSTPLAVVLNQALLDPTFRNRHGLLQRPCSMCGDCITGCNVGAKNTLTTNYLPRAKRNGTQIYTQMEVRYLERCDFGWRVHFTYWCEDENRIYPVNHCVTASNVILGAGSLGSTEILLRSRERGLSISCQTGQKWSTNGDGLGFLRKADTCPNAVGYGAYDTAMPPVGPTVQTTSFWNETGAFEDRLLIQEGAVPRAMANFFGLLFGNPDLDNTLVTLAVGHDESNGRIVLQDNRATVHWPGLKDARHRKNLQKAIQSFAEAHGAQYRVVRAFGDRLATVHPVGGCSMADDIQHGVVNDQGQVFAASHGLGTEQDHSGNTVYQGLFVADGSTLPRSLGVNPLMTISAMSERIAHLLTHNPKMAPYLKPWIS